jgi:hypothetical protein
MKWIKLVVIPSIVHIKMYSLEVKSVAITRLPSLYLRHCNIPRQWHAELIPYHEIYICYL